MRYRRFSCWRRTVTVNLTRYWRKSGAADVPPVLLPASRMADSAKREQYGEGKF